MPHAAGPLSLPALLKTTRPASPRPRPFDPTDTRRDEEYVDAGFDSLHDLDPIADYSDRAGRLQQEDSAW